MNILELKKENFPSWYFERVQRPEDLDNFQFYYYEGYIHEEICIKKVVGTTHINYYHKAWLEMLSNLKRHKNDDDIEFITKIILRKNDDKSVCQYNDNYYITEGNHRFCQAKFLNIEKVHCCVSKYKFNHQDYNLYKELTDNNFTCNYSYGEFKDIQLDNTYIYLSSKEDIPKLISAYKTMRISLFDRIVLRKQTPVLFFSFKDDEDSYDVLKQIIFSHQIKNKMINGSALDHLFIALELFVDTILKKVRRLF